ncbi:MAG: hypothetical protein ACTHLW_14430, partial [Verrucomicrobiota bacterium]
SHLALATAAASLPSERSLTHCRRPLQTVFPNKIDGNHTIASIPSAGFASFRTNASARFTKARKIHRD